MFTDAVVGGIGFGYCTGGVFTERMNPENVTDELTVEGVYYPSDFWLKTDVPTLTKFAYRNLPISMDTTITGELITQIRAANRRNSQEGQKKTISGDSQRRLASTN